MISTSYDRYFPSCNQCILWSLVSSSMVAKRRKSSPVPYSQTRAIGSMTLGIYFFGTDTHDCLVLRSPSLCSNNLVSTFLLKRSASKSDTIEARPKAQSVGARPVRSPRTTLKISIKVIPRFEIWKWPNWEGKGVECFTHLRIEGEIAETPEVIRGGELEMGSLKRGGPPFLVRKAFRESLPNSGDGHIHWGRILIFGQMQASWQLKLENRHRSISQRLTLFQIDSHCHHSLALGSAFSFASASL